MKNNNFKNFIIFWLSQSFSELGSSMTSFALIIWTYKQTNSAMSVSLMTFCSYVPYILGSIFVGTFIDTHRKKTIMLASDFVASFCSVLVLVLIGMNCFQIWHIYFINSIMGLMNAFQSPAKAVAIGLMLSNEKYEQASGMNSFSRSLLTVVAPTFATFLFSFFGLKSVLLIDLITFLFGFVILLFFIHIPEDLKLSSQKEPSFLFGFQEGISFLLQHKEIWYLILSISLLNFFSNLTYENTLYPMILAKSHGNEQTVGIVSGILGFGGIIGGVIVSFKKVAKNHVKLIYFPAAFSFLFGDLLMGLGNNTVIWCIAALCASSPIPFIDAGLNKILYTAIPSTIQGRIFAVRNALQYCTIPLGILMGGFLADFVFEPFLKSDHTISQFLQQFVGQGNGSGMSVLFLFTGIAGFISSIICYRKKELQKFSNLE